MLSRLLEVLQAKRSISLCGIAEMARILIELTISLVMRILQQPATEMQNYSWKKKVKSEK